VAEKTAYTYVRSRAAWLTLRLLVLAVPLVMLPGALDAFTLPKLVVAQILGLLSLALLAPLVVAGAAARPGLVRTLLLALGPMLLLATLGWAVTDHPLHVRRAVAELWVGAACLAGWALALPAAGLLRLMRWLTIPAVALASVAILQVHGLFQPFQFGVGAHDERLQVTALAGNPADLAAFLVLPALLAQVGLAQVGLAAARRGRGWLWGGALGACVYALVVTQTLTAMMALAVASAVFWGLTLPPRRSLQLAAGVLAAVVLVGALVTPMRTRVLAKAAEAAAGDWNAVLTGRVDAWRVALWMLGEHPWTGVGQGAYRAAFVEAKLALATAGAEFYPHHIFPTFANAHNEVLEAGAEWGVPGLLALTLAMVVLLRTLLRASRRPPPAERLHRSLAWSGLTAWLLLSLAHFPLRIALTGFPALLFLAWALRWSAQREEQG
jgi:O-antigen ligase